ncbi:response regulator [Candidatus Aerophobetes bacterium]|nr:response regulator [Candidatus Aerophobetes bacterium]
MSSQPKILIIEDDKDMVEALKIILEGESYRIDVAFDGKQGLDAVKKEKPDLIILDLLLPGEDGAVISRKLKNSSNYSNIPVLVLSALAKKIEDKILSQAKEKMLEVDEYLDKPVSPQDLLEKVRKLLKTRR